MKQTWVAAVICLTGCTASQEQYYAAHQRAAEAQALEAAARYEALAKMASAGGETGAAAVVAIALTGDRVTAPQYIEDPALKWASVLAGPLSNLGALAIQADANKSIAKTNANVSFARLNNEAQTDRVMIEALTRPQPDNDFNTEQLGVIVNGLVKLGVSGQQATADVAGIGLNSTVSLGQAGMDLGAVGIGAVQGIGSEGMSNLVQVGTHGTDSVVNVTTAGYDSMLDISAQYQATFNSFFDKVMLCNCDPSLVPVQ